MTVPDVPRKRVIAIDGPAASGKSTTARRVAERLGFVHLNSGLLYRAFTWKTIREGWDESATDYGDRIEAVRIELVRAEGGLTVRVDGEAPGDALVGQAVAERVSAVAKVGAVREAVFGLLRDAGARFDLVCEGRDIGTTVFPGADLKVYLTAEPEVRALRRLLDLGGDPTPSRLAEEAERLRRRDRTDASRELSPLRKARGAVEVDTTALDVEDVVDRIVDLAGRLGIGASDGDG